MRKEFAIVGVAALIGACSPSHEVNEDTEISPYTAYKQDIERQLLPTMSPEEQALHAAIGCSLWIKTEEGSCSIVDYNGTPTVLTVGHVVATLAHYTDSDNTFFMHIPGQDQPYKVNARFFTTFGNGADPAVIYETDKDPELKKQLGDLTNSNQVNPLHLATQNDLSTLPRQEGKFFTLNPFTRKQQAFEFVGDNPRESSAGRIVLETQQGELCNGDSGIAFYQQAKNGLRYVLGVVTDIARAKDKIVNNVPFRCGQTVAINPPQLVKAN